MPVLRSLRRARCTTWRQYSRLQPSWRATSARVRHSLPPSRPKRSITTVRSFGVRLDSSSRVQAVALRSASSARSIGAISLLGSTSTSSVGSDFDFSTPCRLTVTLRSSQPSSSSTSSRGMAMAAASSRGLGNRPLLCSKRALAARRRVSFSFTFTGMRMVRLWVERARLRPWRIHQ